MTGHLLAVKAADGANHADGQNAELAIRRGGARRRTTQGGEAEACRSGGVEEVAATQYGFHTDERLRVELRCWFGGWIRRLC
ncbi:MAG: hypothetical protein NTW21_29660 [Verrucomicrobia bacterium]|nr:hypothetical protein [Verrucomicrobiota bacterium]